MDHTVQLKARLYNKSVALVLGLALTTGALGGCASGEQLGLNLGMFSSGTNAEETQAQQQQQTQPQALASTQSIAGAQKQAAISFAPLIGPPAKVAKSLSGALKSEAQERKIEVSDAAAKSGGYIVKGYLSASPDAKGAKISYIWDVTGSDGKRAHRITGEDIIPGKIDPKDPWASVNQSSLDAIAAKATTNLANWLPSTGAVAVAKGSTGERTSGLVKQASLTSSGDQTTSDASSTKTRGFSNTAIAIIPQVTGAPGDGNQALADALKSQLGSQGVNIGSSASGATHKVLGKIIMTPPADGKQTITIKWIVQDARGRELGTVSQKNTVPAGSLDGTWGQTASHAAGAAAEGIAKLINTGKSS